MEEIIKNEKTVDNKNKNEMKIFLIAFPAVLIGCIAIALFIVFVLFPTKAPSTQNYALHETGTILNWNITANNFTKIDNEDGTHKYYVNLSVKNTGTEAKEFLGYSMNISIYLIYTENGQDYVYNCSFGWDNELFGNIQPLATKTDNVMFVIPSEIANNTFKLKIAENKLNPSSILLWTLEK